MNKREEFKEELNYIKNEDIRESASYMIEKLPDYFFTIPAASTGKYHPEYAQGEGGLLRHTKAAVRIAHELLENPAICDKYTDREKDLMIMALILHDGLKLGKEKSKYTKFDHPLLMAEYIKEEQDNLSIPKKEIQFLADTISTHMGNWTTDYDGNEVLDKPKTKCQNFVHMCDYLASRKCLLVPFDEKNKIKV